MENDDFFFLFSRLSLVIENISQLRDLIVLVFIDFICSVLQLRVHIIVNRFVNLLNVNNLMLILHEKIDSLLWHYLSNGNILKLPATVKSLYILFLVYGISKLVRLSISRRIL